MEPQDTAQNEVRRRSLSPTTLAAGVIGVLVVVLLGRVLIGQPSPALQIGGPAPDFALVAFDGTEMSLAPQQGRVVVLNFFASWCVPCREEAADLEQAWQSYRDDGVQFFGIAYKDAAAKAQAFLQEYDVSYRCTAEPGNRTARRYGVTGVPETFVIDQQGRLVRHFIGPIGQEQLHQAIDPLLSP